jgi:hypothetical protein
MSIFEMACLTFRILGLEPRPQYHRTDLRVSSEDLRPTCRLRRLHSELYSVCLRSTGLGRPLRLRRGAIFRPSFEAPRRLRHLRSAFQCHLHRATYYSLPEWFHPDYRKYGFSSWPGGNATNPFTNETLPYTGYVPVNDYITDIIVPEMDALANMGTEIMWCTP